MQGPQAKKDRWILRPDVQKGTGGVWSTVECLPSTEPRHATETDHRQRKEVCQACMPPLRRYKRDHMVP